MARVRSVYRCAECGHEHAKWVGRCEACGAWNAVSEEPVRQARTGANRRERAGTVAGHSRPFSAVPARLRDIATQPLSRWRTQIDELDFALGGGIVPGSMTLIGGEPGIGKSTLLLQAAARLETSGRAVL
jgi:DNA repair protein RadA/Sms